MAVCKIEIDFGRQSFRVFRSPFLRPKSIQPQRGFQCTDRLTKLYSDQSLPILDENRPPPPKMPSKLDSIQSFLGDMFKKSKDSDEQTEMAAGGVLTSIHIPAKPDNNFEKVFNAMLPEDVIEQRRKNCSCHKRQHKDVDMNKIMFDLVNSICTGNTEEANVDDLEEKIEAPQSKEISIIRRPTLPRSTSRLLRNCSFGFDFWIGSEYKYDIYQNKLVLKFVLIGQVPDDGKQMFLDIHVAGGMKTNREQVKLDRIGQQNKIGQELAFEMVSYVRTLEEKVHVTLNIKRGFLRKTKCIDEWKFPLNDCHCIYPRSFWKNVKS